MSATVTDAPTEGLDAVLGLQLGTLALDVRLPVPPGSVVAILGPNGAGKTTILRALAGLRAVTTGHVRLGERVLDDPTAGTWVPPEARRVGFVHQDLLLFPHLTALDNVAFGPRSGGASRSASRVVAAQWLERVGLGDRARSKPRELSGGQAQRVALARALAAEPDLLLLDEPLAALDVTTRATTRRDLRHFLDDYAGIAIVVTHDPLDALMLARDVVILEAGSITQAGTVADVTARPRTRYVADLIGTNLLRGSGAGTTVAVHGATIEVADRVDAGPAGGAPDPLSPSGAASGIDTFVTIPPAAVALHGARPEGSARNVWPATVAHVDLLGERVRVHLHGPVPLVAEITPAGLAALGLQVGDPVWASVKATEIATYRA